MRPDRFRAAIVLSIPYSPRGPQSFGRPLEMMRRMVGDHFFYQLYFQQPGIAEAELERDVRTTLRRFLYSASGDAAPDERWQPILPNPEANVLGSMTDPATLPGWLSEADIDYYCGQFQQTGFRGGLNWYRNFDRNSELLAPFSGAKINQPALFICGEQDPVLDIPWFKGRIEKLENYIPRLEKLALAGCGHWVQQKQPVEVNGAIIKFLLKLP